MVPHKEGWSRMGGCEFQSQLHHPLLSHCEQVTLPLGSSILSSIKTEMITPVLLPPLISTKIKYSEAHESILPWVKYKPRKEIIATLLKMFLTFL